MGRGGEERGGEGRGGEGRGVGLKLGLGLCASCSIGSSSPVEVRDSSGGEQFFQT